MPRERQTDTRQRDVDKEGKTVAKSVGLRMGSELTGEREEHQESRVLSGADHRDPFSRAITVASCAKWEHFSAACSAGLPWEG